VGQFLAGKLDLGAQRGMKKTRSEGRGESAKKGRDVLQGGEEGASQAHAAKRNWSTRVEILALRGIAEGERNSYEGRNARRERSHLLKRGVTIRIPKEGERPRKSGNLWDRINLVLLKREREVLISLDHFTGKRRTGPPKGGSCKRPGNDRRTPPVERVNRDVHGVEVPGGERSLCKKKECGDDKKLPLEVALGNDRR